MYKVYEAILALLKKEHEIKGGNLFLNRTARKLTNFTYSGVSAACVVGLIEMGVLLLVWLFLPHGDWLLEFLDLGFVFLVLIILNYDFHVVEAFFLDYHKSEYYLATKTKMSSVWFDKGVQGEFNAYVLSRELKVPHRTLYNVCVPMQNGNFQEIDAVIITQNVIYVLECKNRGGGFQGEWDDEKWVQYIGNTKNECENIYMQNQKHTMALDYLLLSAGILENGQSACINVVLNIGDCKLPTDNIPLDFIFGPRDFIAKEIDKGDSSYSEDSQENEGIMNAVYELLLPYSLNSEAERKQMMMIRGNRARTSSEFQTGKFKVYFFDNGIPGITEPGERAVVRKNNLYTQLQIVEENGSFWQTRTDIPDSYFPVEKEDKGKRGGYR